MRGWAALLALLLLPEAALPDVVGFEIWPSRNADDVVSCRIELRAGQVVVVEFTGSGMPPKTPLRWPVRKPEEKVILHALQAFVGGDLPSADAYTLRVPPAPYALVSWSTTVNGKYISGFYIQNGTDVPPVLATLIDTILPGGPCEAVISAPAVLPD